MKSLLLVFASSLAVISGVAQAQVAPLSGNIQQSVNVTLTNGQSYSGSFDLSSYLSAAGVDYTPNVIGIEVGSYSPPANPSGYDLNLTYNALNYNDSAAALQNNVSNVLNKSYSSFGQQLVSSNSAFSQQAQTDYNAFQADVKELGSCATTSCYSQIGANVHAIGADLNTASQNLSSQLKSAAATFSSSIESAFSQSLSNFAVYSPTTVSIPIATSGVDNVPDSLTIAAQGYSVSGQTTIEQNSWLGGESADQYAQAYFQQIVSGAAATGLPLYQPGTTYSVSVSNYSGGLDIPLANDSGSILSFGYLNAVAYNPKDGMINYTLTADTNTNIQLGTVELTYGYVPPAVSAAPEPSTWVLMMVGVGAVGWALRRAKTSLGRLALA